MPAPTVLLFDVDGTLVSTGGAGRRAMARAFEEVCGCSEALEGISLGGMTDRLILRTALRKLGRALDEALFDAIVAAYLRHLEQEVPRSPRYRVMPHVHEVLAGVDRPHVAIGLGTGNVRRGAEIKLRRAALADRFRFGGFGEDAEDRAELLRTGVRRGAEALGVSPDGCRAVVIGDTPRDIQAAAAIDAACVAVATGGHDVASLRAAGPALVVESLADPRVLPALLGSSTSGMA